jgi:hypothetical protein
MASQYLHILAFNIPYPPDYGGVIDVYYKLKALSTAGVRIILHCFEYGRLHSKELEDVCFKVYYYPRKSGLKYFLHSDPYIVSTRISKSMPEHLLGDSFPVLFEGLHTTGILDRCIQAKKRTLVRAHNIEHLYYRALAGSERNPFKKLFLWTEAKSLKRYEPLLHRADYILGIAKHETAYFNEKYGNALFVPAFHRFEEVSSREGSGSYILFHGNLSVSENSETLLSLAKKTLSKMPYEVVVAGKNPSRRFRLRLSAYSNIRVVANPGDQELDELIGNAHINLLVTSHSTGIKLKLLHALFAGRHCLVNPAMVHGTGLSSLCRVAETAQALEEHLHELMKRPFTSAEVQERKKALKEFSNRANAEKILRILA